MCNRYAATMPQDAMRSAFGVTVERDRLGNQPPLPAIFPRHDAPVVRMGEDGVRELVSMHWGFVLPQTSKRTGEPIMPKAVNNARDDCPSSGDLRQAGRLRSGGSGPSGGEV